jgi:Winged helix DNA-binding domain
MNHLAITKQRLHNQHLSHSTLTQAHEVVAHLGAMQAQDYAGAKWAVAQRAQGLTDAALDQALADGTILRTHVLRPTWHFVTPADIRWMLALTAPRVNAFAAYQYRKCELDEAVFKRSNAVLVKALRGGQQLTRPELVEVFARSGIVADNLQMTHLMMRAELDAVVCSGARRGKQFTYALLDERAPAAPAFQREEALIELARRYLHSHGPATAADFAWWSGLTLTDAKRGFAAVQSQFQQATFNDQTYWFPESAPTKAGTLAHWLPTYDEYLIGYQDRSAAVDPTCAAQIAGGEVFTSTLVLNGQVVGVWKRTLQKREVVIELQLFAPLKKAETNAVTKAAQCYGAFLNLPVRFSDKNASAPNGDPKKS